MRFSSKREILEAIRSERQELVALIESIPRKRWREKGVWGDGWTVHDLMAHISAWEQMFLRWYREGVDGAIPVLPAPGYRWNETPRLNRDIRKAHARRPTAAVLREFTASHDEILGLVRRLPPRRLLEPGHFAWTGRLALGNYLGPNTSSHYRVASRFLRRWLRGVRRGRR